MKSKLLIILPVALLLTVASKAQQDETNQPSVARPDSHAPIGVMGDHLHKKGEFMLSYRFMQMSMKDNREGTNDMDPETIVTTVPNQFFGMPMQPPTLRVVPTEMTMNMHMFGIMYAPADWITLMAMLNIVKNKMDHTTYQGPEGTNVLGTFTTETSGLGDARIAALIKLLEKNNHRMHFNAGFSLPTASITEEDEILTPMNMRPTIRVPYPMQLGSGTFDFLPGVTYYSRSNNLGWGAQVMGNIRVGENDEGYSLGDVYQFTAWGSYRLAPWISTAVRISNTNWGEIDGIDPEIMGPVQTAHPDMHGGNRLDGLISCLLYTSPSPRDA